ncbi:MAG: diguanylate cyclase [Gammaproteobacteria bacterium]|nr:diguanylate cyclase [Gammaproteobacteria bacterium]
MSKLYRLCLCFFSALLLSTFSLNSYASQQNNIRFSSLADEFKNAPVTSYGLAQDQQGFLWLANELDGLQRFDGYQLEEFLVLPPSASNELSISTVMVDSHNRIWIGTWGYGLVMLSEDRRQRQHWQLAGTLAQPADSQKGNLDQIQTTFEDQQQRLWVGTTTGVYYIDAQLRQQNMPAALQKILGKSRIWQINQGQDGQLWFACSEGLLQVSADLTSQKFWSLQQVEYANKTSRFLEVRTVLPVQNGVWLATSDGLFFLNSDAKTIKPLPDHMSKLTRSNKLTFSPQGELLIATSDGLYQLYAPFSYRQQLTKLLHAVDVRDVLSDKNGLIWLATRNRGVFKLSVREDRFALLTNDQQQSYFEHGLNRIASQYYHRGTLWLGLEHAVLSFDMAQKQWKSHSFPEDSLVSLVTGLTVDPNGETWAATNAGLFRLEGNKGFVKEPRPFSRFNDDVDISLMSLSHSADGTLNIGTWQQGLIRWQPNTPELPGTLIALAQNQSDGIQQSAVAPDGTIWLTGFRSGLYRLDPEDLSTTHYSVAKSSSPILPTNNLPCIIVLNNNEVWLCSDNGLLKLDVQHQQLLQWTTADGLPDQRVIAIDARSADSLWLSTRRGLAQFNYQTQQIRSFVEQDGIPSLLLEPRALTSDANGNYYLGTATGVLTFTPKDLAPTSATAKLALSGMQLDQKKYWQLTGTEAKPLRIPADHKILNFTFSLLDFEHSQYHQYRYRLLGLSDVWQHQAHLNSASFSHLPPGRYTLEVEVVSASNPPPPLHIFLKVERHWWMFKLVWILSALSLLVLFALVMRIRVQRLLRKTTQLNLLVDARTSELAEANQQLALQARTDFLTKLPNRLAFTEHYQMIQRQRSRNFEPLTLAMIDIDYFKKINDSYGHEAGDAVLAAIASTLQQRLRQQDILARFGGEEFVLLLPDTSDTGAVIICEMLRLALQQHQINYQQQQISVTATFGVVELDLQNQDLSYWQNAADEALYYGKAQGRNQVVLYADLKAKSPENTAKP